MLRIKSKTGSSDGFFLISSICIRFSTFLVYFEDREEEKHVEANYSISRCYVIRF